MSNGLKYIKPGWYIINIPAKDMDESELEQVLGGSIMTRKDLIDSGYYEEAPDTEPTHEEATHTDPAPDDSPAVEPQPEQPTTPETTPQETFAPHDETPHSLPPEEEPFPTMEAN